MNFFSQPPSIPGVTFLSSRDARTWVVHQFAFVPGEEAQGLMGLLRHLQPGDKICVEDQRAADERYLEVRRTGTEFQIQTSHHGTSGTWKAASFDEALAFLAPSAPCLHGSSPQTTGSYTRCR
ncbi:MAG: hypothetical protein ACO1TE_17070 [Prosthecobacter sp.]